MAVITPYWLYDVLLLPVLVLVATYIKFHFKYQYWKNLNVPVPFKPIFPFGHFTGLQITKPLSEVTGKMYNEMANERYFGAYFFGTPIFIVRDVELMKNMLVKDFNKFHDRGLFDNVDFEKNPLAGHLFMMKGQEWRNLRVKLTPTFTTGKMRMMFPTIKDVGTELVKVLDKCSELPETDIKDLLGRFTTDIISSCAFGIETNSLQNPDAEFRKYGNEIARPTIKQIITNFFVFLFPTVGKILNVQLFPDYITNFFIGVVRDTMQYRKNNNVKRNDFMQQLMQLRDLGYIPDADNPIKTEELGEHQNFTVEQAAAQAFIFFFAGFETSSSTMDFALYELALQPELQNKLQKEVDATIAKHGGVFTYDAMQDMELLDRIVAETLRKYPVANLVFRQCNADYAIPDSDVVLQKDTAVWFPQYGYHHDPQHYPNPELFDPDRFLPEEKAKRHPYAYIPFGEGPRNCIGNRFGLMQVKVGLAMILSQFSVQPSASTPIPIVYDAQAGLMQFKGKLCLKVSKRG